jgi:hypothetical protein
MQFRTTTATKPHADPDKASSVVAMLPAGAIVRRMGKKVRHWLPVSHEGLSGWVTEPQLERVHDDGTPDEETPERHWTKAEIIEIIKEAARRHDQPAADMVRVGRCESNLDPRALNPSGPYHGLFQFLRSTWASTPYAERDIYDPVANASAAAWMWQQGRRGEWACQ